MRQVCPSCGLGDALAIHQLWLLMRCIPTRCGVLLESVLDRCLFGYVAHGARQDENITAFLKRQYFLFCFASVSRVNTG